MEKKLNVVVSASVEKFRQQMDAASRSTGGFRDKIAASSATIAEQKQILIEFEAELAKLQDKLKNTSTSNFAAQKQLKAEMQKLNVAIKDQRLSVRELSNEKTNLSQGLQEVRSKAEANTQAMEAMTRAVNAASMAVLLLGDSNGELQPLVKAAQVTMALFGATVAVTNLFTRQNVVLTNAMAAAQKAFGAVVGTSTGLLKGFRIALAATGVLAAVVAVGYLIEKLVTMGDSLKKLEKDLDDISDAYDRFATATDVKRENLSSNTRALIAKAKAEGKSAKEIYDIRKKALEDDLKLVQDQIDQNGINQNKAEALLYDGIRTNEDIAKKKNEIAIKYGKEYSKLHSEELEIQTVLEESFYQFQTEMNEKDEELRKKKNAAAKKAQDEARKQRENALQSEMASAISEVEEKQALALSTEKDARKRATIEHETAQTIIGIKEEYLAKSEQNKSLEEKDTVKFNADMRNLSTQRINNETAFAEQLKEISQKEIDDFQKQLSDREKFVEESFKKELAYIKDRYAKEKGFAADAFAATKDKKAYETEMTKITIRELENMIQAYKDAGMEVGELEQKMKELKAGLKDSATETTDIANKMAQAIGNAFSNLASNIVNALGDSLTRYFEGTNEEAQIGIKLLQERQKELAKTMKDVEQTDKDRLSARMEYLRNEDELLKAQQSNLSQTFMGILTVVADFMDTLGKALIATAVAKQAFETALFAGPGGAAAAIVAGGALIGLAAVTKAYLAEGPKFAKGGIAYGEVNNATFGEYYNARSNPEVVAPLSNLKSILGLDESSKKGNTDFFVLEHKIKGSELVLLLKKANKNLARG